MLIAVRRAVIDDFDKYKKVVFHYNKSLNSKLEGNLKFIAKKVKVLSDIRLV